VPSQSYNPSGTFLASCSAGSRGAAGRQMAVGDPLAFGVVEPASLALGMWGRAVELVLQVLRVDAVVPARPASGHRGLLVRSQQARTNTHHVHKGRANKGVCEADSDSDDNDSQSD
jgi:hypothetical protein